MELQDEAFADIPWYKQRIRIGPNTFRFTKSGDAVYIQGRNIRLPIGALGVVALLAENRTREKKVVELSSSLKMFSISGLLYIQTNRASADMISDEIQALLKFIQRYRPYQYRTLAECRHGIS